MCFVAFARRMGIFRAEIRGSSDIAGAKSEEDRLYQALPECRNEWTRGAV